jgi:hypothetical protein
MMHSQPKMAVAATPAAGAQAPGPAAPMPTVTPGRRTVQSSAPSTQPAIWAHRLSTHVVCVFECVCFCMCVCVCRGVIVCACAHAHACGCFDAQA